MTKILISGYFGKMGQFVKHTILNKKDCSIIAGLDVKSSDESNFPIVDNLDKLDVTPDVIIDFSHPCALSAILTYSIENNIPVVLCTTGYSFAQEAEIKKASESIAVFYSGNMSLGINLLIGLSKKASSILGDDFDVEIIEKHHNQKIDAPSGTAIMIANSISSERDNSLKYVYDRHSVRRKREKNELGIHSLRGGTIVGEHEVVFAGDDEVLTLKHEALSKQIFATGAVNAAIFLANQDAGMYDMSNII